MKAGILITKWDFHLQMGKFGYKTRLSFTKIKLFGKLVVQTGFS